MQIDKFNNLKPTNFISKRFVKIYLKLIIFTESLIKIAIFILNKDKFTLGFLRGEEGWFYNCI